MAEKSKVVTKYATKGGAIVNVVQDRLYDDRFQWECAGCGETGFRRARTYANQDGQSHAKTCAALPLD
ncbi:hypothetical protein ACFCXP_37605 [Streptomyces niveus]|uniref:hypothetical protein n=1 Tax=Streptomyces niveus TaxID=193462 RepID=UPI0035DD30AF